MINYKNNVIECSEWDRLVKETYKRPYKLQQQDGCMDKGNLPITVPSEYTEDEYMNDSIAESINGDEMGVKFNKWLERDPKEPVDGDNTDWKIDLFWERNFYPDLYTLANDLHKKGLIEAGNYTINIDW